MTDQHADPIRTATACMSLTALPAVKGLPSERREGGPLRRAARSRVSERPPCNFVGRLGDLPPCFVIGNMSFDIGPQPQAPGPEPHPLKFRVIPPTTTPSDGCHCQASSPGSVRTRQATRIAKPHGQRRTVDRATRSLPPHGTRSVLSLLSPFPIRQPPRAANSHPFPSFPTKKCFSEQENPPPSTPRPLACSPFDASPLSRRARIPAISHSFPPKKSSYERKRPPHRQSRLGDLQVPGPKPQVIPHKADCDKPPKPTRRRAHQATIHAGRVARSLA